MALKRNARGEAVADVTVSGKQSPSDTVGEAKAVTLVDAAGASVTLGGTGASSQSVQGPAADNAAAVGNPVWFAAKYYASTQAYADGDVASLQANINGILMVGAPSSSVADGSHTTLALFNDKAGGARPLCVAGMAFNGATWDKIRGDTNGQVVQRALGSARWQFAGATGGITDTSDVALMAAGGASVRNHLLSLQYFNSAAVASEIVIKDGSTVIWRGYAPASMTQPAAIQFEPALRGTANTALNVAMLTTGTATRVSAQGYQGV